MAGRTELAKAVAAKENITVERAKVVVDNVFSELRQLVANEGTVQLRGFGSFRLVSVPDRQVRNPLTGESSLKPAHMVVKFKQSSK